MFVPKGLINNIPALAQKMAWCDKATTHYLNNAYLSDAYMGHSASMD